MRTAKSIHRNRKHIFWCENTRRLWRGVRRVARCFCFVELWFAEISVMFSKVVAKVVIFFIMFFFFPYFAYQPSTYAPSRTKKKHLFFTSGFYCD